MYRPYVSLLTPEDAAAACVPAVSSAAAGAAWGRRGPPLPEGLGEPAGEGGDGTVALRGRLLLRQEPRPQRGVVQAAAAAGRSPVNCYCLAVQLLSLACS